MSSKRPPLGLAVEVEDADGRIHRWDGDTRNPADRPDGLQFRTQRFDGFADASVVLPRRITRDWPDLNLLDTVRFIGHDGSIAYEGRHRANPRSNDPRHEIEVSLQGWMTHARDRTFSEIYVDRDLNAWQAMSRARRVVVLASSIAGAGDPSVAPDETNGLPALLLEHEGSWGTNQGPTIEAWYDAKDANIARLYGNWERHPSASNTTFGWGARILGQDDPSGAVQWNTSPGNSGDQQSEPAVTGAMAFEPTTPDRFAVLSFNWTATSAAGTDGAKQGVFWRSVSVWGNHGLTRRGTAPDDGFYASDVMRNIVQRFCPKLDPSGIQDTTYPIKQLTYRSSEPYAAFEHLNSHHLWNLSVFEGPTLHYYQPDLSKADWEVRLSDEGTRVQLQGDSIEDLANGVVVTFTDFSGNEQTLYPPDHAELRDDSESNPANRHGIQRWESLTVPFPTTQADALQIGRAYLGEFNAVKAPGTISITGHIRDAQGNWQSGWRVREGQTVAIVDHPNDRPRLITDTSYIHTGRSLSMTVDASNKRLEALFNRIVTARSAAGLA